KGYVHLRSSVDSQQVEVESPPLPPRLVINGGENLINISSVIGSPLRFKFDIENVGGGSVAVSLTVPDGFRRLNGEGLISLGAKSKSQIQMEFDSERAGDIYDYFDLSWGDNAKRIIVKGNVSDEPKNQLNNKARVKVSPRNKGNGKSANDYDYPILKRIEKQRKVDESLPKISEVELIERDKHSIVLGWSNPTRDEELSDSSALGYVIETRVHRYDKEMKSMIIEWRELGPDYATIQKKGTMVEAKIKGLSPDGKFTFRLFCENEDGAVSVGSVPFQFQTESSFKFTKANWIFLMGAGGAFLALVCIIIQRKGSFKE
ncbi:MAG: fibronectin type III domain-containing protein, partial [Verrucomicrobiales bacterium]|nr:fibronectin type III domain-containing protein [Verrucomicrobiales bacterium]